MSDKDPATLDPSRIASRDFANSFRGFDPTEVRSFLRDVADAMRVLEEKANRPEPAPIVADDQSERVEELEASLASLRAERDALRGQLDEASAPSSDVTELEAEISTLRAALAEAQASPAVPTELDASTLTKLLGEETTRVLDTARSAAAEISARAQADADRRTEEIDAVQRQVNDEVTAKRKDADEYSATVRSEADAAAKERLDAATAEAERLEHEAQEAANELRSEADAATKAAVADAETAADSAKAAANEVATAVKARAEEVAKETRLAAESDAEGIRGEADAIRSDAQAEAARTRAEAAADAETSADAAREQARQMVTEAQAVREKILADLVKRRRNGRQQLDQVKAARDRMARALATVKVQLDESVAELDISVPEARQAMDEAARVAAAQNAKADAVATAPADAVAGAGAEDDARSAPETAGTEAAGLDAAIDADVDGLADDGGDELDGLFARIREEQDAPAAADSAAEAASDEGTADESTADKSAVQEAVDAAAVDAAAVDAAADDAADDAAAEEEPEPIDPGPDFTARDVALTRYGVNVRRKVKRALADDQSDVLDRLQKARRKMSIDDLPTEDDQVARYRDALVEGLGSVAKAGAKHGGAKSGGAKSGGGSQSAIDDLVDRTVKSLHDSLRAKTEASVIQADGEVEEALEAVRAHYRDARATELPTLVEDALNEAFAIGLYDALPKNAPVRWITDPRETPSPDCFDNTLADDVTKPGEFPTGHRRPLGSPGCRCLVIERIEP